MTKFHSWLNFVARYFTTVWSIIANCDICFNIKNCIKIDLNSSIDIVSHIQFPKSSHSLTQKGKKVLETLCSLRKLL